jgi:hypothetical protein
VKRSSARFDDAQLERMRWVSSLWVALLVASAAGGWSEGPLPVKARPSATALGADCGGTFQVLSAPAR